MIDLQNQTKLISLTNLTAYYDDFQALCEINLDFYQGEFIGICGPNGSGKTTLLKAIMGLINSTGEIKFHKENFAPEIKVKDQVGYVPQMDALDKNFPARVKDIVMMGRTPKLGLFRRPKKIDFEFVRKAMEDVGVSDLANKPIGKLSGGQLQRVMVARALVQEPKLLLLDEPTSAMDFRATTAFMNLLSKINTELGLTILVIHHDLQLLKDYASRIICMDKSIEWVGSPTDSELDQTLMRLFFYKSSH